MTEQLILIISWGGLGWWVGELLEFLLFCVKIAGPRSLEICFCGHTKIGENIILGSIQQLHGS